MNEPEPPYEYLGNFSAVDPAYSKGMACHDCRVEWTGCWDEFLCPKCGQGELPKMPNEVLATVLFPTP